MPSAGERMPRACDAIDMDGDLVCNLVEEHPGAHNDPIYGEWFSTERALLADMREGDDFPCCGPDGCGHGPDRFKDATIIYGGAEIKARVVSAITYDPGAYGNLEDVSDTVVIEFGPVQGPARTIEVIAARDRLKAARMARRPVTKT